jgi:hypothetical protein
MKELKSGSKTAQDELKALQKSLAIEFDSDKFARAQELVQGEIERSTKVVDAYRQEMDKLKNEGAENTDTFRRYSKELAQADLSLLKFKQTAEQINDIPQDKINAELKKEADLTAEATANAEKLQKETDAVNQVKLDKAQAEMQALADAGKAVSIAATAALTGIAAAGLSAVASADDIATLSDQYGITAEQMQKLQYIAMQTDVSDTALYKGLTKARAAVADLSSGITNTASEAIQQLGIDFNSLEGSDEQFYAIVGALSEMDSETEKVRIANEIFGDNIANQLLPLINAGTVAIEEYSDEFSTLGALTDEQVEALAAFDNTLNRLKTQFSNVKDQLGAAFLPVLERIADIATNTVVPTLQRFADWLNSLSDDQIVFAVKALAVVAALGAVVAILPKLITGFTAMKTGLGGIQSALSTLAAHPIIAVIAAVVAVLVLLYTTNEQFRESINKLIGTVIGTLSPLLSMVTGLLGGLFQSIMPILTILGDLLAVIINLVMGALQPFFDALKSIFELISPFIQIALIPLQLALSALAIPLQFLGQLLQWLAPVFTKFAEFVKGKFEVVLGFVNKVIDGIEDSVNWVIDKINFLIRGINDLGGWLGIEVKEIASVSFNRITTSSNVGNVGNSNMNVPTEPTEPTQDNTVPGTTYNPDDYTYDPDKYIGLGGSGGASDSYTYTDDHSSKNITINVTVENYAAEVDVDSMVTEINRKLAEAM